MVFLRDCLSKSFIFIPSIRTSPLSTSYIFDIKFKMVVFPEPDLPTKAMVVFGSILKDRLSKILLTLSIFRSFFLFFFLFVVFSSSSSSAYSIYEYETFLKIISPLTSSTDFVPKCSHGKILSSKSDIMRSEHTRISTKLSAMLPKIQMKLYRLPLFE